MSKAYEYELYNERLNEHEFVYANSKEEVFRDHPSLDPKEWRILRREYLYEDF